MGQTCKEKIRYRIWKKKGGWRFSERAGGQANKARKTTKRGSGIVYADGSEVEMQVENIESIQEEGGT